MIKSIVVAVDGSEQAARAVSTGAEIAASLKAKLDLISVVDSNHMEIPEDLRHMAESEHIINPMPATPYTMAGAPADIFNAVNEASAKSQHAIYALADYIVTQAKRDAIAAGANDVETWVEVGNPADKIVSFAILHAADLIITGRRGFGQFKGLLLGSTSYKVSLHANCSCLTVN